MPQNIEQQLKELTDVQGEMLTLAMERRVDPEAGITDQSLLHYAHTTIDSVLGHLNEHTTYGLVVNAGYDPVQGDLSFAPRNANQSTVLLPGQSLRISAAASWIPKDGGERRYVIGDSSRHYYMPVGNIGEIVLAGGGLQVYSLYDAHDIHPIVTERLEH